MGWGRLVITRLRCKKTLSGDAEVYKELDELLATEGEPDSGFPGSPAAEQLSSTAYERIGACFSLQHCSRFCRLPCTARQALGAVFMRVGMLEHLG